MSGNQKTYDVVILGGGPAGISAAIWCADLGLDAILLEREAEFGGALLRIYNRITNYPGLITENGRDMRDRFLQTAENFKFERRTSAEIVSADLAAKCVTLANGDCITGRSIIIATGTRRRELGIPGESEFIGCGILDSGVRQKNEVAGKHVLVVGGGDAAVENALILSETAARITLVHRRDALTARREFVDRLDVRTNIEIKLNTVLVAITGTDNVNAVELQSVLSEDSERISVDNILIRIGVVPNTESFRDQIQLDPAGYVIVDRNCATSLKDIFAAGDVASAYYQNLSYAVGSASVSIKKACETM